MPPSLLRSRVCRTMTRRWRVLPSVPHHTCWMPSTSISHTPTHSGHTTGSSEYLLAHPQVARGLTGSRRSPLPWAEPCNADEDTVLDTPHELVEVMDSSGCRTEVAPTLPADGEGDEKNTSGWKDDIRRGLRQDHLADRVGDDIVDLVTDAFAEQRERIIEERRRALYRLTHPDPLDYTYNGKLIPPPPFNFGRVTEEAIGLGEDLMVKPQFSLVFQAASRASSCHIPKPTVETLSPSASVSVEVSTTSAKSKPRGGQDLILKRTLRRTRKEEREMFADHTFFFEINDLYVEIVLVGKANAGKSSLLNALLGQPFLAKSSSTPHTTRTINFYQSATQSEMKEFCRRERHNLVKLPAGGLQLTFVDIPGYGIEGMSDQWRDAAIELTDNYFGVRRSVNTVLFCVDCQRGLTKTDIRYFKWLENIQGVFFVLLTKCDTVPHSRVCSVMRQIYSLITTHRKRFRKVYPFILPTSAATGENIDVLRGLITETSGMIPGDRLRSMLKEKQERWMSHQLAADARRLEHADDSQTRVPQIAAGRSAPPLLPSAYGSAPSALPPERDSPLSATCVAHKLPYGGRQVRLNTGLDIPLDQWASEIKSKDEDSMPVEGGSSSSPTYTDHPDRSGVTLPVEGGSSSSPTYTDHPDRSGVTLPVMPPSASFAAPRPSCVIGHDSSGGPGCDSASREQEGEWQPPHTAQAEGRVSDFLDRLEEFQGQDRHRRLKGKGYASRHSPSLIAEGSDGRLASYTAGKQSGPSLVSMSSSVASRKAEWRGKQLGALLKREDATAPWRAVEDVKKKVNELQNRQRIGFMTPKEASAYLKNAGRITASYEKFESEVATTKFMTEVRQTKTLRSQQQMHFNATGKISYRSMPPGLWKRYGQNTSDTSSVVGRENDETHERHTVSFVEDAVRQSTKRSALRRAAGSHGNHRKAKAGRRQAAR